MDRFVIMVDAGYLLHKGVEIVSKKVSLQRRELDITDPRGHSNSFFIRDRTRLRSKRHRQRRHAQDGAQRRTRAR
jgi:hypothetical protein